MRVDCKDLERVLREQEPAALAALEAHGQEGEGCRGELDAWNEISMAAQTLQHREETPRLWAGIRARLEEEARVEAERNARWNFADLWQGFAAHWQLATATLVLLAVTATGTWMLLRRPLIEPVAKDAERRLLTDQALKETQAAETAYVQAIDKLAALAEPKLAKADTPLAANYREKLMLLDAAIAECRKQAEANKYNAHLQRELTSMYQEKQRTLEEVLRED